ISRKAFEKTGGFAPMRVGEDIDLSITLWENGFQTELFQDTGVYHKRRSTLESFSKQVYQFGTARPILFHRHPNYKSWIFWFPFLFLLGSLAARIGFFASFCIQVEFIKILFRIPMAFWLLYSLLNF